MLREPNAREADVQTGRVHADCSLQHTVRYLQLSRLQYLQTVRIGVQRLSASFLPAQAEDTTVEAMQEHVARAVGLPARRQFLVVAEERARGASLGHLAKRMQVRNGPWRRSKPLVVL